MLEITGTQIQHNSFVTLLLQLTKMAVQQGLLQQQGGGMPFLSQTPLLPGSTAPSKYSSLRLDNNHF